MSESIFRRSSLDATQVPPGADPEEWAALVRGELRHRNVLRGLLLVVVLLPVTWIAWQLGHPPPGADEYRARASELFDHGNARAALSEIKAALRAAPEHAGARHLSGRVHLYMGNYGDAVQDLFKARELGLEAKQLDAELGVALLRQGDYGRLLGLLDTSPLQTADAAEWHALRGAAQRALGKPALAAREFSAALARDSSNARARRGLARLALDAGRAEEARRLVEHAIAADPRDADGWLLKGEFELAQQSPALAEDAFRKASELNPFRHEGLAGRTRALLAQNELELAGLELKALAALAPQEPETLYLRGALAERRGDAATALDAWQQVMKVEPGHAETQRALGRLLGTQGQLEQAFELLGRYVSAHPQDVAAVGDFARCALALDSPQAALEALAGAGRATLADPELVSLLGMAALAAPAASTAPFVRTLLEARPAP